MPDTITAPQAPEFAEAATLDRFQQQLEPSIDPEITWQTDVLEANSHEIEPVEQTTLGGRVVALLGTLELEGKSRYKDNYVIRVDDDEQQTQRQLIVYRSISGGAWRISQGLFNGRFVKGKEAAADAQYTQDTRLHPELEAYINKLEERRNSGSLNLPELPLAYMRFNSVEEYLNALTDFEEHSITAPWELQPRLQSFLDILRAGHHSISELRAHFALSTHEASDKDLQQALMEYVKQLNKELEKSNIMPSFSSPPIQVNREQHPLLGQLNREVYVKRVARRQRPGTQVVDREKQYDLYEWHMLCDEHGGAWLDTVRLVGGRMSAFGAESEPVDTGILTSKPLEYERQASGIPERLKLKLNGHSSARYVDIRSFLGMLYPSQEWQKNRPEREQKMAT